METLPYLLPWILLLLTAGIAVAVKFLDIKSIMGIAVVSTLGLVMLLIAIYANIITSQQYGEVVLKQQELTAMEEWKYQHMDELSLIIAQQRMPSDETQALVKQLISYGWKMNNRKITDAQAAHLARERLIGELENPSPMLIKGIPTMVDEKIVDLSLRQLGFTVIPYRDDETPEEDANIIYYGRDMTTLEVKLAALTLMRAGIELKAIKAFPKVTQGNLRAIKIEWNKYYISRKALSVEEVASAEAFK